MLVPNTTWPNGATSNGVYTGVVLEDVLERACGGIALSNMQVHVEFFSAEACFKFDLLYNFAVNVPFRFVEKGDVMLAWEMNEEVRKIETVLFSVTDLVSYFLAATRDSRLFIKSCCSWRHWSSFGKVAYSI